jgi:hypothetical protein
MLKVSQNQLILQILLSGSMFFVSECSIAQHCQVINVSLVSQFACTLQLIGYTTNLLSSSQITIHFGSP